ncbi:hypothetical protein HO173_003241 [Letharia columbiana]|uniref:Uncharacterized protein n=1 Tax=Letharia columbiana TaxID=112416 RepID=A0A8H6G1R5_9LECA|nr:uncharacterized protein HO173_003241 [Letharia columbiana]KAF6238735.1 hypothetical protein HO173_003241 [Letharia columbiana]
MPASLPNPFPPRIYLASSQPCDTRAQARAGLSSMDKLPTEMVPLYDDPVSIIEHAVKVAKSLTKD